MKVTKSKKILFRLYILFWLAIVVPIIVSRIPDEQIGENMKRKTYHGTIWVVSILGVAMLGIMILNPKVFRNVKSNNSRLVSYS